MAQSYATTRFQVQRTMKEIYHQYHGYYTINLSVITVVIFAIKLILRTLSQRRCGMRYKKPSVICWSGIAGTSVRTVAMQLQFDWRGTKFRKSKSCFACAILICNAVEIITILIIAEAPLTHFKCRQCIMRCMQRKITQVFIFVWLQFSGS